MGLNSLFILRRHTDEHSIPGLDYDDVVIDSQDEIMWRFRALCGLKNTLDARIIAVGGAGGWSQPADVIRGNVDNKYRLNIRAFSYDDLGKLTAEAMADRLLTRVYRKPYLMPEFF